MYIDFAKLAQTLLRFACYLHASENIWAIATVDLKVIFKVRWYNARVTTIIKIITFRPLLWARVLLSGPDTCTNN